jgi:hypothetical protein
MMQASPAADFMPCDLQYVASLIGGCPDESCPLWQPGGTAYAGHCVFGELDVPDRRTFESWLSALRTALEGAGTADERNELRQLYYRLLNESAR